MEGLPAYSHNVTCLTLPHRQISPEEKFSLNLQPALIGEIFIPQKLLQLYTKIAGLGEYFIPRNFRLGMCVCIYQTTEWGCHDHTNMILQHGLALTLAI